MSPAPSSYSSRIVVGDGDFSLDGGGAAALSPGRRGRGGGKVASSFPRGGFDLTAAMKARTVPASELTTVSVVNAASLAIDGEVFASFCLVWFSIDFDFDLKWIIDML